MTDAAQITTLDAFEQFIALPENRERRFELIDGDVVEKPMPTREHGIIAAIFTTRLVIFTEKNNPGYPAVEARHRPTGDPRNDRLPDISVVLDANKPIEQRGAADYLPDVCVEIKSPDDSLKDLRAKARFYLAHGARLVWIVIPEKRLIEWYTAQAEDVATEDEVLGGHDVLPGFTLPVRDLFPRRQENA